MNVQYENEVQETKSQHNELKEFPKTTKGIVDMIRQKDNNLALHFFQAFCHVISNMNAVKAFLELTIDEMNFVIDQLQILSYQNQDLTEKKINKYCLKRCREMLEQKQRQLEKGQKELKKKASEQPQAKQNQENSESNSLVVQTQPQKSVKQTVSKFIKLLFPISSGFYYVFKDYSGWIFLASLIIVVLFYTYFYSEEIIIAVQLNPAKNVSVVPPAHSVANIGWCNCPKLCCIQGKNNCNQKNKNHQHN